METGYRANRLPWKLVTMEIGDCGNRLPWKQVTVETGYLENTDQDYVTMVFILKNAVLA